MTILCTFRFQCDRRWEDLAMIAGKPDVRYCDGCEKPVFHCTTYDQLADHIAASHCVAIRRRGRTGGPEKGLAAEGNPCIDSPTCGMGFLA